MKFPKYAALLVLLVFSTLAFATSMGTGISRSVSYADHDIVAVHAKVRFSTLIVLPKSEKILDYTTGDKEFWIINGSQNFCYVKPAKSGIRSNINLITASGNIYSFLLSEVNSEDSDFDLKVFVESGEPSGIAANAPLPKLVPAAELTATKAQAEAEMLNLKAKAAVAQMQASDEVTKYRSEYPIKLSFDYIFEAQKKPFLITAIYHDDVATYIRSEAQEKPAIYELKDGVPTPVTFDLKDGVYVVPKVLDQGYLVLGKKTMEFLRHE